MGVISHAIVAILCVLFQSSLGSEQLTFTVSPSFVYQNTKDALNIMVTNNTGHYVALKSFRVEIDNERELIVGQDIKWSADNLNGHFLLVPQDHVKEVGKMRLQMFAEYRGLAHTSTFDFEIRPAKENSFDYGQLIHVSTESESAVLYNTSLASPRHVSEEIKLALGQTIKISFAENISSKPALKLICPTLGQAFLSGFVGSSVKLSSEQLSSFDPSCRILDMYLLNRGDSDKDGWFIGRLNIPIKKTSINSLGKKQLIEHIFRVADRRPNELLSYIFTALCLVPVVTLVFFLQKLNCNIKGFPIQSIKLVPALVFHGSCISLFLLYFFFWTKISLIETLSALLVLLPILLLSGYCLLTRQITLNENN